MKIKKENFRQILVRVSEVQTLTGLSKVTIRKLINEGKFPAPQSNHKNGWRYWHLADIYQWLETFSNHTKEQQNA